MRNLPSDIPKSEIQPFHSLGGTEHICSLRKSCTVLYGIFTEIARMLYHDKDGRLEGTPDVVWKQGGTEIWIDNELRWEDEHPECRPAIYIQLGQIQYRPYTQGMHGKISPNNRFGESHYEFKVSGQVTFMHVAATTGEACALADNTEYGLSMLQAPIQRDFCMDDFSVIGRIPLEKLPKESSDRFASGVTFSFEFTESWDVKVESPILKTIDFMYEDEDKEDNSTGHDTISRDNILTASRVSGT